MGNCVICGTSVDGPICSSHEQDVLFEFEGNHPQQLSVGRYYKGTVDGFADFGVFIDIGKNVTGLLHKSELNQRLESIDWNSGDTVFIQVLGVRDNGNVDLGSSIRQSEREFRGKLIQDAENTYLPDESETERTEQDDSEQSNQQSRTESSEANEEKEQEENETPEPAPTTDGSGNAVGSATVSEHKEPLERVTIDSLSDRVGERVRIEGEIVGASQTSGPTVFELRDETAVVDCAAFKEAGVRAYPEVDTGDVVRLVGDVELRNNELQVETEQLDALSDEEEDAVVTRLAEALEDEARPADVDLLAEDSVVSAIHDDITDAAGAIRRAVIESRPVIVRHNASAEGYVAGAALERAVLPLVREEHARSDAQYHYFDRRPLEDGQYDMQDATKDATNMLDNRERHDEKLPLFVLVDAGSTVESSDGLDLLDIYGAPHVVIDTQYPDDDVAETAEVVVNSHLGDSDEDVAAGVLGANVAAHINDDVREDVSHLPAVSYWEDTPSEYVELAEEAGYDEDHVTALREAVALEAYYQSYEDKRELITDLLFEHAKRDLAEHISEQFRTKLENELDTAEPNLSVRGANGVTFTVLDTDAYTHRFDFPPTAVLLDALHRHDITGRPGGQNVTLGLADDEIHIRSDVGINVRDIEDEVRERAPDAGIVAVGTRNGKFEFLRGEREAALDAVIESVSEHLN
ncbi:RecJ-like exonuclease, contains DnaJ-type Zn finger domain [Haladaptatus litoreus]|uniref:RecJ-like exonuclease, contains DnaJ-type Zn finger domain n=1 Tax=Haladaptatus litoreus TaxID=553468 RepID=A0A1N6ZAC9_9EURY|nr:OB-fold nucleic acid binding domain-containing protein [Haladaptatus litoreus]SIR23830.1 RecJ-like exonuclease, contains DnaJ-type Zn finger domain [Haladaptatus litoreus]